MMQMVDVGSNEMTRRSALKLASAVVAGASLAAVGGASAQAPDGEWDKLFPKSDRVDHRKVRYTNRLGIDLVADLYTPKDLDRSRTYPALVVGHPMGAVKEQASGLYAQTMAERGYITLAHDASYYGESGGASRFISSPEAWVEDFSAGVDFLGTQEIVDRDRIGGIGVCASGAFILAAAQIDPRIKAVATASMVDMGNALRDGLGMISDDDRRATLAALTEQRWSAFDGGLKTFRELPQELPENSDPMTTEFFGYYRTERGFHPRATTAISNDSTPALFQFRPFDHLDTISPRPLLLISGDVSFSRAFTELAFEQASEPKELHLVPGAGHVDLYDRVDLIPWDKLQSFFDEHLI